MSSRFDHVIFVATIVYVFLGMASGNHGNKWVRLPNFAESPHIKNQSLMACTGKQYASLSFHLFPRRIACGSAYLLYTKVIPKTDILHLQCKWVLKWNRIIIWTGFQEDLCQKQNLDCPLMKGETYTIKSDRMYTPPVYCFLWKGHYYISASCSDQNNQEVACLMGSCTWTN